VEAHEDDWGQTRFQVRGVIEASFHGRQPDLPNALLDAVVAAHQVRPWYSRPPFVHGARPLFPTVDGVFRRHVREVRGYQVSLDPGILAPEQFPSFRSYVVGLAEVVAAARLEGVFAITPRLTLEAQLTSIQSGQPVAAPGSQVSNLITSHLTVSCSATDADGQPISRKSELRAMLRHSPGSVFLAVVRPNNGNSNHDEERVTVVYTGETFPPGLRAVIVPTSLDTSLRRSGPGQPITVK
jgi:hypothetical protein